MNLPKAKLDNIVVQSLKDEILIYDLSNNQAFCLNDTASKVFNACDGKTTFDILKSQYQFTDEIIYLSLDQLKSKALIEGYTVRFLSRREAVRRAGLSAMIALPVITSLIAPSSSQALSTSATCPTGPAVCTCTLAVGQTQTGNGECQGTATACGRDCYCYVEAAACTSGSCTGSCFDSSITPP